MYELKVVRERRAGYGEKRRFQSSTEIWQSFKEHFDRLDREHFLVLLLDAKNTFLGYNTVSIGTLTSNLVHPREVFAAIVLEKAAAIIFLHNHPSGDPTPSAEDIHITKRLREICDLMGVKVLDHIIFGGCDKYISFVDDGYWERTI